MEYSLVQVQGRNIKEVYFSDFKYKKKKKESLHWP